MQTSSRFLTLYVDPTWKREHLIHSMLLNPFWGVSGAKDEALLRIQLAQTHTFNTTSYGITDNLEKADMVFMPYCHRDVRRSYPELLSECHTTAQSAGKPLLVDGIEDIQHIIELPHTYVLRYGGYRFETSEQDIVIPPLANDLLEMYCSGTIEIRKKGKTPVVGFAGWSSLTLYQRLRTTTKELPDRLRGLIDSRYRAKKKGVFFRGRAISILKRSSIVTLNLLARTSYSGHVQTASKGIETLQREFIDNLIQSDYGLDIRGDANASTRLFEILSLGRIPIIIDTERNLPFRDVVDYDAFSVTVDFRRLSNLPSIIADFHNNISEERFEQMQRNARDAFVTHFRIDALMSHIIAELQSRGALS